MTCMTVFLLASLMAAGGVQGSEGAISYTADLPSGASIVISNSNGDITVESWDSPEVLVEYRLRGTDMTAADPVEVLRSGDEGLIFSVGSGDWAAGSLENTVDFIVKIPGGEDISIITETFSGNINVSSISGSSLVEVVSGSAHLEGLEGDLRVNVVSGSIDIIDASGLRAVNIVSGTLRASLSELSGDVLITSVEGAVELELPADVNLLASTFGGNIDMPFADIRDELVGTSARYDGGGSTVNVETYSGDITAVLR